MEKTLLVDLKKKMFIRSALLALDSLDELLNINDYLSPDEILLEIIKKALREYENTLPLVLDMNLNRNQMESCSGKAGYGEFKSNFTLYLNCAIDESQIVLVPRSCPLWRCAGSYPLAGSFTYFSDYQEPYVFLGDLPTQDQFSVRALCARPIIPDFLPDKSFNPVSEKAAVYWMNVEEGAKGSYFLDLCMVHLLDYLRQLKSSIMLHSMPVDVMSNLDPAYQELRARCDHFALQSGWDGQLLI
jgi:hypothetical protein